VTEPLIPPDALAEYDQAFAASASWFGSLCDSFELRRVEDAAGGIPEPVSVVSLAQYLVDEWDRESLASVLSYAVVRHGGALRP